MTKVDGPLVVLAVPGGGEADEYLCLAAALDEACHVVGLREPGHYGTEHRPRSMNALSAKCRQALRDAGFDAPVAIVGLCSGGVLAHQMACDMARAGHQVDLVVLLDTPIPGQKDDRALRSKLAGTVRHGPRSLVTLTGWHAQGVWYRMRQQPMPRELAYAMTFRSNMRRMRDAKPSFFDGHQLFVQAIDRQGMTETEGAPEYWSRHGRSTTVATTEGSHTGPESFLSRENAGVSAAAIVRELEAVRGLQVE
jgi:thioesterase domain-containing protein